MRSLDALLHGEIDAAAIVASSEYIHSASSARLVRCEPCRRSPRRRLRRSPSLSDQAVLPMGVGNFAANRPAADVNLVAPEASLLVRRDLHPAIQISAAGCRIRDPCDTWSLPKARTVPRTRGEGACHFPRKRVDTTSRVNPFLQRYLTFSAAVLTGRFLVLLIPMIDVAYPLLRVTPALYRWSMRHRNLFGCTESSGRLRSNSKPKATGPKRICSLG